MSSYEANQPGPLMRRIQEARLGQEAAALLTDAYVAELAGPETLVALPNQYSLVVALVRLLAGEVQWHRDRMAREGDGE